MVEGDNCSHKLFFHLHKHTAELVPRTQLRKRSQKEGEVVRMDSEAFRGHLKHGNTWRDPVHLPGSL